MPALFDHLMKNIKSGGLSHELIFFYHVQTAAPGRLNSLEPSHEPVTKLKAVDRHFAVQHLKFDPT